MTYRIRFFAFLFVTVGFFPTSFPSAQTLSTQSLIQELQKQIETMQQQMRVLQTQLEIATKEAAVTKEELKITKEEVKETKKEVAAVKQELIFTRSLGRGTSGDEVKKLQEFLSQFPDIYPEKLITGFFGALTEKAVKKFQEKQGIETVGSVGPKTLAKINEFLTEGAGKSGVVPPGLLQASGIQPPTGVSIAAGEEKIKTSTTTSLIVTTTLVATTTTSSGTIIPAIPATPAIPSTGVGTVTVPATPATPAIPAQTVTTGLAGGMCWVSGEYPGVEPKLSLPDVGAGYAKLAKPGINTLDGLKTACGQTDYDNLFQSYCSFRNSTTTLISPLVQQSVYLFDSDGYLSGTCGAFGCGRQTCPIVATSTSMTDTVSPSIPTNFSATAVSTTTISLQWTSSTDNVAVTGYTLYKDGSQMANVATTSTGTLRDTVNGLSPSTTYTFGLVAYDAQNNRSVQATVSVATPAPPPPPPPPPPASSGITVDLKVNGQDSLPSSSPLPYDSIFTVTWTTSGSNNCVRDGSIIPQVGGGEWDYGSSTPSGSVQLYARHANFGYSSVSILQVGIRCYTPLGPSDYQNSVYDSSGYIYLSAPTSFQKNIDAQLADIAASLARIAEQIKALRGKTIFDQR